MALMTQPFLNWEIIGLAFTIPLRPNVFGIFNIKQTLNKTLTTWLDYVGHSIKKGFDLR